MDLVNQDQSCTFQNLVRDGALLLLKVKEKLFSSEKLREQLVTPGTTGLMVLQILN